MLVLGIDSSCDDMSAAVVADGKRVLSNIVSSQDDIHKKYGGIVPELAARRHVETVVPVVEEALLKAGVSIEEIDGIGVTYGPGLVVSLLVGLSFAKSLAFTRSIPLMGVNHLEGHLFSFLLEKEEAAFPILALIVSGGHTILCVARGIGDYTLLGQTRDDAAGEAFDKTAKLLGLGYPGGIEIDRRAREGNPKAIKLPKANLGKESLDFSFSGLKTAAYRAFHGIEPSEFSLEDFSASFQETVVDTLIEKTIRGAKREGIHNILITGGVAANSRLRAKMAEKAEEEGLSLCVPSPRLCTDNGAMIAAVAYHYLQRGERSPLSLNAVPNLQL